MHTKTLTSNSCDPAYTRTLLPELSMIPLTVIEAAPPGETFPDVGDTEMFVPVLLACHVP